MTELESLTKPLGDTLESINKMMILINEERPSLLIGGLFNNFMKSWRSEEFRCFRDAFAKLSGMASGGEYGEPEEFYWNCHLNTSVCFERVVGAYLDRSPNLLVELGSLAAYLKIMEEGVKGLDEYFLKKR